MWAGDDESGAGGSPGPRRRDIIWTYFKIGVVWDIAKGVPKHWYSLAVGISALLLGLAFPVNPIWLVLLGGLAGGMKVLLAAVFTKNSSAGDRLDRTT